ncbi:replication initiator protein [Microviridae sp.]|nr:replication initiator protein [Microviridae sp.]
MCYTPLTIKQKDSSILGTRHITVPCGKCLTCLNRKAQGWTFRLEQEALVSKSCHFITFTYSDENLPRSPIGAPTLVKSDFQKFLKRLRKNSGGKKIKYYACGEYGTRTQRPHYHAIMYNIPTEHLANGKVDNDWGLGHIDVAQGNNLTMKYVCKYIMKSAWKNKILIDEETGEVFEDDRQPEFPLMSKNLGKGFITSPMIKYLKENLVGYVTMNDRKVALPRYYKERIFTEHERKLLTKQAEEFRQLEKDLYWKNPHLEAAHKNAKIRKHKKIVKLDRNKI